MPPGPWRTLALDFEGAAHHMEKNQKVFDQTEARQALDDMDELHMCMTHGVNDPDPLHTEKIGKPAGLVPLDLAVGVPVGRGAAQERQANGCVAVNPKH